jgi:hypothetical protein
MALNIQDQNDIGIRLVLPNSSSGSVSGTIPNVSAVYENEAERIANENQRIVNEQDRQNAEVLRENTKTEMDNLIDTVETALARGDFKGDKGDKRRYWRKRRYRRAWIKWTRWIYTCTRNRLLDNIRCNCYSKLLRRLY